jgi:hypothetical protein
MTRISWDGPPNGNRSCNREFARALYRPPPWISHRQRPCRSTGSATAPRSRLGVRYCRSNADSEDGESSRNFRSGTASSDRNPDHSGNTSCVNSSALESRAVTYRLCPAPASLESATPFHRYCSGPRPAVRRHRPRTAFQPSSRRGGPRYEAAFGDTGASARHPPSRRVGRPSRRASRRLGGEAWRSSVSGLMSSLARVVSGVSAGHHRLSLTGNSARQLGWRTGG